MSFLIEHTRARRCRDVIAEPALLKDRGGFGKPPLKR
jgi:hypothetical protein